MLTNKGKMMPVNPGIRQFLAPKTGEMQKGFVSHWETCPSADQHRNSRKKKEDNNV